MTTLRDALATALGNDQLLAWDHAVVSADAILSDPAFRAALVEAVTEALVDHRHPGTVGGTLLVRRDHIASYVDGFDCAAAIVAGMLGEPT